jgi:hypothetical protein
MFSSSEQRTGVQETFLGGEQIVTIRYMPTAGKKYQQNYGADTTARESHTV